MVDGEMEVVMHWIGSGLSVLLTVAFIAIGGNYLARPPAATAGFGLLPPSGSHVIPWLGLKGVRDRAFGVGLLAAIITGDWRLAAFVLLVEVPVTLSDMLVVLSGNGSGTRAFGLHGLTAALMILAATLLLVATR